MILLGVTASGRPARKRGTAATRGMKESKVIFSSFFPVVISLSSLLVKNNALV
jgi:hypothetical protein